jgi:hypothetical protein
VEWQLNADEAAAAAAATRDAREVSAVPMLGHPDPVAAKRAARLRAANERAIGTLSTYLDRFFAAAAGVRLVWAEQLSQLERDAAQPGAPLKQAADVYQHSCGLALRHSLVQLCAALSCAACLNWPVAAT